MIEQILEADRYLQVDRVDKAREIYTRVVEMDPGNAIATVGLAQCALANGDDAEAYALASKALMIDPENDMARRMEARLAEIMVTRGETVDRPEAASTRSAHSMRPMVTEPGPSEAGPSAPATEPEGAASDAEQAVPQPMSPESRSSTPSTPSTPSSTRPVMRKSLLDRLLGR